MLYQELFGSSDRLVVGKKALAAVVFGFVYSRGGFGDSRGGTFYIISMGVPGALALTGLLELATGRPFEELADRWDAMPAWKKGVVGISTVLAAAVVIFGPLLLYGWIRDG